MPKLLQVLTEATATNRYKYGIKLPLATEMPYLESCCKVYSVSIVRSMFDHVSIKNKYAGWSALWPRQYIYIFFLPRRWMNVQNFRHISILARGLKTNSLSDPRRYVAFNMADVNIGAVWICSEIEAGVLAVYSRDSESHWLFRCVPYLEA